MDQVNSSVTNTNGGGLYLFLTGSFSLFSFFYSVTRFSFLFSLLFYDYQVVTITSNYSLISTLITSMKQFDKVRLRGTEVKGVVLETKLQRMPSERYQFVEFLTVKLEDGQVMIYEVSELMLVSSNLSSI